MAGGAFVLAALLLSLGYLRRWQRCLDEYSSNDSGETMPLKSKCVEIHVFDRMGLMTSAGPGWCLQVGEAIPFRQCGLHPWGQGGFGQQRPSHRTPARWYECFCVGGDGHQLSQVFAPSAPPMEHVVGNSVSGAGRRTSRLQGKQVRGAWRSTQHFKGCVETGHSGGARFGCYLDSHLLLLC